MLHPDYNFDLNHSSENEDEFLRTYATRFSNLSGYGRLQTPSGTYVGTFEGGMVVGDAKFHRKDGVLFEGIWKRNKDGTTSSISEGKMSYGNLIYQGDLAVISTIGKAPVIQVEEFARSGGPKSIWG